MNVNGLTAILRASWWLLILGGLVGGAAAFLVSLAQTPEYTSSTQFFVSTTDSSSTADFFQGSQFSQSRVASYAQLIQGEELANRVVQRLNLPDSADDLRGEIEAIAVPETVLIDVTVSDPSASRAQQIAEAIGVEFPALSAQLERVGSDGLSPVKVTVTRAPGLPQAPTTPRGVRNMLIGVLVGLVAASCVAIIRRRMDQTVKDSETASSLAGAPVIGTILRDAGLAATHMLTPAQPSRTLEDYRQLRNSLQFLSVDEPPKVVMVSSALPAEGKTTLVVNLALALVEAGRTVTIVDADLRKPKVSRYLGMVGGVGLTNVLSGAADIADVRQQFGDRDLQVIGAGPTPPNPGELLSSSQMFSLLERLRAENDFVLVDAPPLLPVADAGGLAVYMDGVILSVHFGKTRREQLHQTASTLNRLGVKVLGVVLNMVPSNAELSSAYGYGYTYGYEPDDRSGVRAGE